MIDEIDRQLISFLQEDARLTNAALAEKVGLTASTVHERVKKLEKKGIIKGYIATVDAEALGKPIMAFIRLSVSSASTDYSESRNSILNICQTEPDILECHSVAGEDCYILRVRAAGPADLEKLLGRVRCSAQIIRTTTNIVLSTLKQTSKVTPVS
ncbi:MAG: Lrp/AsnC family transcriptional regulator [Anaerolineae bacterium]|nr:Lrp/AsnC family transcriptional regulator [Anaerolineae bacterium]